MPEREVWTYTPPPPTCPACGAELGISGGLDELVPGKPTYMSVTIKHPEPVCGGFGVTLFRDTYFPTE